jgi:transposase-like protein
MMCPRCESDQAYVVLEAEDRSWEVYRCPRCNFNWRSSEGEEITDARQYDCRFKLSEKQIQGMVPNPPIPPLEKS